MARKVVRAQSQEKKFCSEWIADFARSSFLNPNAQFHPRASITSIMSYTEVMLPLPLLPEGWSGESGKDFKPIGRLTPATQRSIEPVGPHFLAHARRARHKRTFSEDDRIQAQENVKKVEDDDAGEISEPEDPSMLLRDAKDWKVRLHITKWGASIVSRIVKQYKL